MLIASSGACVLLKKRMPCQAKMCLRTCAKCTNSDSSRACLKSHPGICSPLIHSIVSNDSSISGQRRPWSDCADAQADLGLRCPYMPDDTFSHGEADLMINVWLVPVTILTKMLIYYHKLVFFLPQIRWLVTITDLFLTSHKKSAETQSDITGNCGTDWMFLRLTKTCEQSQINQCARANPF